MPRTKIVCTLGPASSSETVLRKMMQAGMDVVRINFSHGKLEEHLKRIEIIRYLNKKYRRHIRILGDLEGHRIRIGQLKDGKPIEVKKSKIIYLTQEDVPGEGDVLPFDYHGSLAAIKKGSSIFIDDGNIALESLGVSQGMLKARVVVAGSIKPRKGINMPDVDLGFTGVAQHDRPNIAFCLEHRLDFMALSFVTHKDDVLSVRKLMAGLPHQPKVIAKIEDRQGIKHIDGIIGVCDGIMVARGDMGVSLPIWEVPVMQKTIIRKCNVAGKMVITATQMLESMVDHRLPTRAEASDVANAVWDGTDHVMLSAETAVGQDPAGCVAVMNKIIDFSEKAFPARHIRSRMFVESRQKIR